MSAPVFICPFSSHQLPNFSLRTCWLWQYMHPLAWYTFLPASALPWSGCGYGSSPASFWYGCSPLSCQNGTRTRPSHADENVSSAPRKTTIPRSIGVSDKAEEVSPQRAQRAREKNREFESGVI